MTQSGHQVLVRRVLVRRRRYHRAAYLVGAVKFRHSGATNGADDSGHAGDATAGIERRDHGRRGHDLVVVCSVAAAHTGAAATDAGRRQRQRHIATAAGH